MVHGVIARGRVYKQPRAYLQRRILRSDAVLDNVYDLHGMYSRIIESCAVFKPSFEVFDEITMGLEKRCRSQYYSRTFRSKFDVRLQINCVIVGLSNAIDFSDKRVRSLLHPYD